MTHDRRDFLTRCVAGMLAVPAMDAEGLLHGRVQDPTSRSADAPITAADIAAAEKIMRVRYTDAERTMMLRTLPRQVANATDRSMRPHPFSLAPALVFQPSLKGAHDVEPLNPKLIIAEAVPDLPKDDLDILYAPVVHLSKWIRARKITSERLTTLCIARLKALDPSLKAVITLMEASALAEARAVDAEIAGGISRGWLHGIPYGAKDLLDTKGVRTTFGAEPYRDRIPTADAAVVHRLRQAGAVLVAKLSLGALAYGDIWFGGRTNNPWNLEQGSSGSSAGSAATVAAGALPFAIGSETLGSILSPSMRCGTTGLRPTFGRVARTGAMPLCWSLDKLGPITRCVEDTAIILDVIHGADDGDASSLTRSFHYDGTGSLSGHRIGVVRDWQSRGTGFEDTCEKILKDAGCEIVELEWPNWNYSHLLTILNAEAATSFEALTLSDQDDQLTWQAPEAWPNAFREARFISAIDLIAADRFRRMVMVETAARFAEVEAVLAPSMSPLLTITNFTGHPALVLRAGFLNRSATGSRPAFRVPTGVALWGHLFDEGSLVRLGRELEARLAVRDERPPLG